MEDLLTDLAAVKLNNAKADLLECDGDLQRDRPGADDRDIRVPVDLVEVLTPVSV